MKKYIQVFIFAVLAALSLTACSSAAEASPEASGEGTGTSGEMTGTDNGKLQIVTTIFPEYDWVREILGDQAENAEITLLLDNGVDMHSYQPSAGDILKISTCDLFLYVGGESDKWVADALEEAGNENRIAVSLMETLGENVKEEELVEGMEGEHGEDKEDEEDAEYDEHVWLSLKNAGILCQAIADALAEADPAHAEVYQENAAVYIRELSGLDGRYQEAVNAAPEKVLVFGDRFPFRYLTEDYGLTYYAAFPGCSAETEASFETVIFLAEKLDEVGSKYVLAIEKSDQRIAQTIIENTQKKDQQILTMDSMQSVTLAEVAGGTTYLSVMEKNLDTLKKALE